MFIRISAVTAALLFASSWYPLVISVNIGVHPDRMYMLPGYPHPLSSAWYSGYLDYEIEGTEIHTHYVYIEAEETEDPASTPLLQ